MKYDVRFRNNIGYFDDIYTVEADDPEQARSVAIKRLVEETGTGLEMWEITGIKKGIDRPSFF